MSRENYMQKTADELGFTKDISNIPTVSDAVRLTPSVRRPNIRKHVVELIPPENTPPTLLCAVVKHLVTVGARFEAQTSHQTYLCGAAEWHFTDALTNPNVDDGRMHPYEQTVIYTHEGKPVIVAKGDPHGKPAAIVCGNIDGDDRFTLGMMGLLRNQYDLRPKFQSETAGVVTRPVPDSLRMQIIRPSTWISFPPDVRRRMIDLDDGPSALYAHVHKHGSIEQLAQTAAQLVDHKT